MPIDLSFIGQQMQPFSTQGGEQTTPPDDENVARVRSLLQMLGVGGPMESAPQPAPPQLPALPTTAQRIGGGIGDAFLAFANARIGHPVGMGPFAQDMQKTEAERMAIQNRYAESQAAQAAADRNERNRIRGMAGVVAARNETRPPKSLQRFSKSGVNAQGQPTAQEMTFDPASGQENAIGPPEPAFVKGSEGRVQLIKNAKGDMEPVDVNTGLSMWTGKPVHSAVPPNMAGVQQNLSEAKAMLTNLTANYMAGPGHVNPQSGEFEFGPGDLNERVAATAAANLTKEGTVGKKLGLGGYAGKYFPNAVLHQRDLDLIPVSLAFPLSMTRRAVEGPMRAIRGALPDYSDPPEVWKAFTNQMNEIIDIASTLPWDQDPEMAANQYEAELMKSASKMSAIKSGAAPQSTAKPSGPSSDLQEWMKQNKVKVKP